MTVWRCLTFVACLNFSTLLYASEDGLPFTGNDGFMQGPLAQFGKYLGDWKIEDSRLSRDGSGWSAGPGARWIFSCLGNGTAIQDFWLPPDGKVGTNLRTYDPEPGTWEIAWAITAAPGFSHIRAKQDENGNIVMHYVAPVPSPLRRITFFPPDDAGWNWTLEFSQDEGDSWIEVYRIRATPFSAASADSRP